MAESASSDKTEKPSAQKLRQAREQGNVVRSRDVATAIGVVVSLKLIVALMPGYLDDFRLLFAQGFASLDSEGAMDNVWSTSFTVAVGLVVKMVLPLLLVPLAGVLASLYPGGWVLSAQSLVPSLERFSPAAYVKRIFSGKHYYELGLSVLKAAALGAVLWHVTKGSIEGYLALQGMTLDRAVLQGTEMMLSGVFALSMVFVLFAAIDLPAQTFFFLRKQRMSKQDLKDEHKSNEGRPEVKQRMKQLQRQIARRSVNKTVPTADVVIVNPEHYAVALKYDQKRAEAPFVVAKGVDEMALYIREVAAKHGIETVPLPPLARAIYNTSQVHQQIPMPLYTAVAQVLTYVLQLKAFRNGRRPGAPALPSDLAVPTHLSELATT
jgi:flagellar biosynthetic protein FlhB